jgi:integrase
VIYSRLHKVAATLSYSRNIEPTSYPWHEITYRQAQMVRASVTANYAPRTARALLSALRGVLKRCHGLEMMSTEAYHSAIYDLKIDSPCDDDCGRELNDEELRRLFAAVSQQRHPEQLLRDTVILTLALYHGLRIAEVRALNVNAVLIGDDGMPKELSVAGKGQQLEDIPLHSKCALAIKRWLVYCERPQGPLRPGGPLILSVKSPWFRERQRRISKREIYQWPKRLAKRAGIASFTMHDLRRTCVSTALEGGIDIAMASRIVRHKNIATTAVYDKRAHRKKNLHDKIQRLRFADEDVLFSTEGTRAATTPTAAAGRPAAAGPTAGTATAQQISADRTTQQHSSNSVRSRTAALADEDDASNNLWLFDAKVIAGMKDTLEQQAKRIAELEAALKGIEGGTP